MVVSPSGVAALAPAIEVTVPTISASAGTLSAVATGAGTSLSGVVMSAASSGSGGGQGGSSSGDTSSSKNTGQTKPAQQGIKTRELIS